MARPTRHYISLKTTEELWGIYNDSRAYLQGNPDAKEALAPVLRYLCRIVYGTDEPPAGTWIELAGLPSLDFNEFSEKLAKLPLDRLIVALRMDHDAARLFDDFINKDSERFDGFGADVPIAPADHFCPAVLPGDIFSNRAAAERIIGAKALQDHRLSGNGVNVVLIDQSVNPDLVRQYGGTYGGRLPLNSAETPADIRTGHATMIVRNILSLAPGATIFDCPILPPRLGNLQTFLSKAHDAYTKLGADIDQYRTNGTRRGPWVIVNAWAVYDTATESERDKYTSRPEHIFNVLVNATVDKKVDLVFAAGNCGQFAPDIRCGKNDRGPGRSILGANSHPRVLSVGSVRADGAWLGNSSQGPGLLTEQKPDICAPSEFRENNDAYFVNAGSSAACGITAGVIAALRSGWSEDAISPDQLRAHIKSGAKKEVRGWDERLGYGVLNVPGILEAIGNVPRTDAAEA